MNWSNKFCCLLTFIKNMQVVISFDCFFKLCSWFSNFISSHLMKTEGNIFFAAIWSLKLYHLLLYDKWSAGCGSYYNFSCLNFNHNQEFLQGDYINPTHHHSHLFQLLQTHHHKQHESDTDNPMESHSICITICTVSAL